jgi:hypothetical protein
MVKRENYQYYSRYIDENLTMKGRRRFKKSFLAPGMGKKSESGSGSQIYFPRA